MTEGRSTGIPKILREMAANGSPAPEFDSDDDRTYYLVRLPVHPRAKMTDQAQSGAQSGAQSREALLALAEKPLSANELVKKLGLRSKTGAFKRTVSELLNDSSIKYTVPDKPTSRLQKYQLTGAGKHFMKAMQDQKRIDQERQFLKYRQIGEEVESSEGEGILRLNASACILSHYFIERTPFPVLDEKRASG